jgi:hypothetical protein
VKSVRIAFIIVLFFAVNGGAGELPVQDDPAKAVPQADTAIQPQDVNNPENTLPTEQQQKSPQSAYFGKKNGPACFRAQGELFFRRSLARGRRRAGQVPDKHEVPGAGTGLICSQI